MKTVFDLRDNPEKEIYGMIETFYAEDLKIISLKEQSINACTGCWSCWLKTPGNCVIKDSMTDIYPAYVNSDTVILIMDTAQGFINHKAKAFLDRTIPHYHPYIELVDGECHHVARYEKYPDMVFFYDAMGLSVSEEQVIEDYLYRTAYHFKSKAYRITKEKNNNIQLKLLESRKPKNKSIPFGKTESMDKLVIYNGSPRKSGSNSTIILLKIAEALRDKVEIRDLKEKSKWQEWSGSFEKEKNIMLFMPLYVHAMPSHVMEFIETLNVSDGSISFFVQSGFPESSQSYYLEAYFEQLALRLGRTYLGTVINGGLESLHDRPLQAQGKMIAPMTKTMTNLVVNGEFNSADIEQLARPVRFGKIIEVLFKLLGKKLINSFWDQKLKSNGAYENRFARPY